MATTTPNFGWAVPTSSDLVKNGATAIETLGDSIDASLVDLKGGTTGQVLAKQTNTDMDFTWSTPSAGSSNVAGKNGVLNSNFSIWQRGTSFDPNTASYSADRWACTRGVGGSTISRQTTSDTTNLPFIQYCARVQRTAGNTATNAIYLTQSFENVNSTPFINQTVTLSFYARKGADLSAAPTVYLASGTGTDQNVQGTWTSNTYVINQTPTLTTTWARYSYTGTVASSKTQIAVMFVANPTGTAGAADYFEVTGVQLEIASSASAYSPNAPTYQAELAACQRYYTQSYDVGVTAGTITTTGGLQMQTGNVGSSGILGYVAFPTKMRIAPTVTLYSRATGASGKADNLAGGDFGANSAIAFTAGQNGVSAQNQSGSTLTVSYNGVGFHYVASAEL